MHTQKYPQVCLSSGTEVYPHMPILHPHTVLFHERRISSVTFTSAHLYGDVYMRMGPVGVAHVLADSSDFGLLGERSSQKKCDSLPGTPITCCAEFAAASSIPSGENRNHTKTQTVTNISTHCLSACMDNEAKFSRPVTLHRVNEWLLCHA